MFAVEVYAAVRRFVFVDHRNHGGVAAAYF
jgi:hypothetical protein